MNVIIRHRYSIIGIIVGACAGYIYYALVGCTTGHCMITSRPLNSTAYGALIGFFMVNSVQKKQPQSESTSESKPAANSEVVE